MKIFIDFDDVLFDTKRFISDIKVVFAKNGISENVFRKYYKDTRIKGEGIVRKYDPYAQMKRMKAQGLEISKVENEFKNLVRNTRKYIFKDASSFLKKMKKEELHIVSYGDKKFQKEKIINSGIAGYFKKIMIIEVSKAVAIKKILKRKNVGGEALVFIDDREIFLKDIKKSYPGMVTILMRRLEGRYDDEKTKNCDFEAKNFEEVSKIVKA
jgi:FMN phosphatase YigB (HAD superfamily)